MSYYSQQMTVDYKFTKNLLWLINLDLIINTVLGVLTITRLFSSGSGQMNFIINYISVIEFLYVFFFFLFKKRTLELYKLLSGLFFVFMCIGMLIGLAKMQLNMQFLSHIFEYIMPVFMLGFGRIIVKEVSSHRELMKQVKEIVIRNSYLYIICVIIFRVFHSMGLVYYPAYGAGTADFIAPFLFLGLDSPMIGFGVVLAGILCGKRAVLVKMVILVAAYYFFKKRTFNKQIRDISILICGIAVMIYLFQTTDYFNRILLTFNNFFVEDSNLNLATGGRSSEVEAIVHVLDQSILNWILGCGFGVLAQVDDSGFVRSYSHFTPLAYTLITGCIFATLLYINLFTVMCKCFFKTNRYYRMCGVYMLLIIVGSAMGASLLNVPKYWLIIGCVVSFLYKKEFSFAIGRTNRLIDNRGML